MPEKYAFVDIGELGWSLYLSAHTRWLKRYSDNKIMVMTSPDRRCLYEDSADAIVNIPVTFYYHFKGSQNCFGLRGVSEIKLKKYFQEKTPPGFIIPDYFEFKCIPRFKAKKFFYTPYKYKTKLKGKKEIIVFPRYRKEGYFKNRNLSEVFYTNLINKLCNTYKNITIRSIGTHDGSYDIDVKKPNYINSIGETKTIQDLIDRLQLARITIGSQSAPPKLALLQKVPTFMIGHQKDRHLRKENWLNTSAGFYVVPNDNYSEIKNKECMRKIIKFIGKYK